MMKNKFGTTGFVALVALLVAPGCDPEIPQRDGEPVNRVEAVFDAESGVIPLPNDAAMDDGKLPGLPGAQAGTVEEEFSNYLQMLRGWLPTTPIEIPFSGPLDDSTIDDESVRLYRIVGDGELESAEIGELNYLEDGDGPSLIEVVPADGPMPGEQFATVVTKDLYGANGAAVGEPLPIFFAASPTSLLDSDGQPTLSLLADDPQTAQTLEGLRLLLKPIYDGLEAGVGDEGAIDRDDVAMAFRWTITPNTKVAFNPDAAQVPLPNTAALDDDGTFPDAGTCEAGEPTAQGVFDDYLASRLGWPDITPITVPLTDAVDEDSLQQEDVVQLWQSGDGQEWERVEEIAVSYRDEDVDACTGEVSPAHIVDVMPAGGMHTNYHYFAFVTRDVEAADGSGELIPEVPMFLALQPHDVANESGESLLGPLSDEDAQGIQGLKQIVAPAMEQIEEETGLDYEDMAAVWNWHTWQETFTFFDPDQGLVPIPNTAALDEDGTFPEAATCEAGQPTAQGHFDEYLAGLSGWPDATPITVPLTGAIDEDSITDENVQLWREQDGEWGQVEDISVSYRDEDIDNCTGEVSPAHILDVMPEDGMDVRENYFAFVTRDLAAADGVGGLVPQAPMLLALQPHDVIDGDGQSVLAQLSDEDAQGIQGLKQIVGPAMEAIESETGLDYQDMAAVWNWHTWDDTFVIFDPETAQIPFPNLFLEGDDGTINIPVPADADPLTESIFGVLNQRPGFSPTAPGWLHLSGEIDPDTLTHDSFAIGSAASENLLPDDYFNMEYQPEWDRVIFEPTRPFGGGEIFAGVMTQEVEGINGRPIQAPPLFVFLRSPHPLEEDGESLVDALDDATATQLEVVRSSFQDAGLFFLLEFRTGTPREDLAVAWAYETEDPVQPLREYRALAMDALNERDDVRAMRECEVEADQNCADFEPGPIPIPLPGQGAEGDGDPNLVEVEDEMAHPNDPDVMIDMSNVRAIYRGGEFTSLGVDLENAALVDSDERIGVSVYLPEDDQSEGACEAPYDVAIVQHGLSGDRLVSGPANANDMAAYPGCMATVAMDLPLHGGRTPGVDAPHPESTPEESGAAFLTGDLVGSKANFIQAVIDLFVLTRVIQGEDGESGLEELFVGLDEEEPLFGENIGYVGVSLGGIVGVPFAALEPAVDTIAISAAGGRMTWILEGDEDGPSTIGGPLLEALGQESGLEPGDVELFEAMTFVQWMADHIDPFVFGETAVSGDLPTLSYDADTGGFGLTTGDSCDDECPGNWECETINDENVCVEYVPETQVLMQMAQGDRTIVNRSTEALADVMDVSLEHTTFDDVPHGFLNLADDSDDAFSAGQCARRQAATWLESGLAGEAMLPQELEAQACLQN